jgi:hypothetical protein
MLSTSNPEEGKRKIKEKRKKKNPPAFAHGIKISSIYFPLKDNMCGGGGRGGLTLKVLHFSPELKNKRNT